MKHKFKILNALPLVVFFFIVLFSSVVLYQLKINVRSERSIASQLIGKNIPKIYIPKENYIKRNTNLDNIDFKKYHNQIFVVNFFASWCSPCKIEAPIIDELSKILPVIGIAYKDKFLDTKNFLNDFGNPYKEIGIDRSGKIAIEWGVYGVPETFLINKKGEIIYRHAGPILYSDFKDEFLPILKKK